MNADELIKEIKINIDEAGREFDKEEFEPDNVECILINIRKMIKDYERSKNANKSNLQ